MAKTGVVGRKPFEFNQYAKLPRVVCDDTWTMNSQCSTQWDGLRHWAYQSTGQFYNGNTLKDFFNEDRSMKSNVLGIQNWEKSGIVGRGVLLDFDRWRRKNNIEFSATPLNPHKITIDQLKATAKDQGTEIKFGDILFIRNGFTVEYAAHSDEEKKKMGTLFQCSGVEQGEQTLEWIWSNFSAVASDGITFEYWRKSDAYDETDYIHLTRPSERPRLLSARCAHCRMGYANRRDIQSRASSRILRRNWTLVILRQQRGKSEQPFAILP